MFVQTETTPNPNSLKFMPGKTVSNCGPFEITKKEKIDNELVRNLLSINGVTGIFLGVDFISVNKKEEEEWEDIKHIVISLINDFYSSGKEFVIDKSLDAKEILVPGKMSVINVSHDPEFGSIVLRDLLNRILQEKRDGKSKVPVLIIIDEVHQFYKTSSSKDALGALDTICRVGRSSKIGVIFSTQNEEDLPKGVSSVVNSKLYFKTDSIKRNNFGVNQREIQSLKAGYGVGMIHGMPNLNVFKFPLSCSGVPKL